MRGREIHWSSFFIFKKILYNYRIIAIPRRVFRGTFFFFMNKQIQIQGNSLKREHKKNLFSMMWNIMSQLAQTYFIAILIISAKQRTWAGRPVFFMSKAYETRVPTLKFDDLTFFSCLFNVRLYSSMHFVVVTQASRILNFDSRPRYVISITHLLQAKVIARRQIRSRRCRCLFY